MDIIEQAREKIAEISTALRAVGLEPWGIAAYKRGDVSVTVEAPGWQYPTLRHDAEGVITASIGVDIIGTFDALEGAADAIAVCVQHGMIVKQDGERWRAAARNGVWWGGATRDEAISAALAVTA